MTNSNKKLVTHNGSFHADDIFACATLSIYLEKIGETFEVIRTRDEEIIKTGDYVFDLGGIYDEKVNRFDHHQTGGAGKRQNCIEYSSFGLVWRKFSKELCGSEKVADLIDRKLVAPVDAFDNGISLVTNNYDVSPYFIDHLFFAMRSTWKEENKSKDQIFLECVEIAKKVLTREIIQAKDLILAEKEIVFIYQNSTNKKIIILDQKYPWNYIIKNFPEPIFVIYPRKETEDWAVEAVSDDPKTFKNRKDFPAPWAGLRDEELANVSGVRDAVFCHRRLFLAVAKSKEGAVKLAQIAVES
jgi:uncharacterized UPF0160 family protein